MGMKEIAAGGVVYRQNDGAIEIQMIEDRFGKMTLAKGRMEPGETVEQTALREIAEETGIAGRIAQPISVVRYQYEAEGRGTIDKEVHYFLVEADGGELQAQVEEIAGVGWYAPTDAWQRQLSAGYDNNREVLGTALALLGIKPKLPRAVLSRTRRPRLEQGHPWVYANEIERWEGAPPAGGLADIADAKGKYLATGYVNPASQITIRVVSYAPIEAMDAAFFRARFERCAAFRDRFVGSGASCRLVYGEADFLPGLIVDRFSGVLVVQVLTLGMEKTRDVWLPVLTDVFRPAGVYERSDVGVRMLEGLEERTGVLYGECPRYVEIEENGLRIEVDIEGGQKTGYFHDQRENRAQLAPLMKGWGARSGIRLELRETEDGQQAFVPVNPNGKVVTFPYWDGATVLECFAHTGSFTLHACQYGAKKVTCLDVSAHAVETAKRNVERNGFSDRVEFVVEDAFEYLRRQVAGRDERAARARKDAAAGAKVDTSKPLTSEGRTWDVIILDPPAFAKTKKAVAGACRGYKDINLHAMKLLNEGGYLVTASCSYHVRPDLFLETIQEAARDAGKTLRLIEWRGAGRDHPMIAGVEEGHYLKFGIFEVRSRTEL